jgi:hypothetical protein
MPSFAVRVFANAQRPPTFAEVGALGEALTDFQATTSGGPTHTRWTVTMTVSAMTIEGAGGYGVELVIDAANGTGMPPSDIAAIEVATPDERNWRDRGDDQDSAR